MELLYNVALWILLWPVRLPLWLWQQEMLGKVFASLWVVCWLLIGLNFLPKPTKQIEFSLATSANLRYAEPPAIALPMTTAPLIETALVRSSPISAITPAPTEPAVFTVVPGLIAAASPRPLLTASPTQMPMPTRTPLLTMPPILLSTSTASPTVKLAVTATMPVVATHAARTIEATATPTEQATISNPSGFTCVGGCTEAPDPSCAIKGNVNAKGDKIYHLPSGKNYALTRIKPAEGDRWFCTEQEAQDAGFRVAKSY